MLELVRDETVARVAVVSGLAIAYMAISTGLLGFNKYLMHVDRFPFAIFLGLLHMSASFGFNAVLFWLSPKFFPSLSDPEQNVSIDSGLVLNVLLPIAGCFAAQLVLSNVAFMHSSIAFLQMMKESNVVVVYLISLALALEKFDRRRATVLVFILGATALTIHGEARLSHTGLTLQGVSVLCESMKLTLQSYTLSASGRRLDALTYVMLLAPLVFLVLSVSAAVLGVCWPSRPVALMLPSWQDIVEYRSLLVANGCLAFAMNISHALFIKNSSAITFILTGIILKDVMIVIVGSVIMGNSLTFQQAFGFALQLVGILAWSLMKLFPEWNADVNSKAGWEVLQTREEDDSSWDPPALKKLSKSSSNSTIAPMDDDETTPHSVDSSIASRGSFGGGWGRNPSLDNSPPLHLRPL